MRKIKVALIGSQGKMGQLATHVINNIESLVLSHAISRGQNLEKAIEADRPDCVLDFSDHLSVFQNAQTVLKAQLPLVIGASGLTQEQINHCDALCQQYEVACLIVPNFSLSACAMAKCAQMLAPWFEDIAIIEKHHKQKKDAPSGTASYCQQILASHRDWNENSIPKHSQEVIPITSLRMHGVLAEQELLFGNPGDKLSISQAVLTRDAFMPGIKFALTHILELRGLVVGLEKLWF